MICYLFPEPTFFFFSSNVPTLLYYAQIPATVVALLLSSYVFLSDRHLLLNKLLFTISLLFLLWTTFNLIAWTNINGDFIAFVWSMFTLILGLISIFSVYFIYVFLNKKDVSGKIKTVFFALLAPILILAPTSFNLSGFNITSCDAFEFEWFPFKVYGTLLGVLAMVWIFVLLIRQYRVSLSGFKKQIILMGVGMELFLFSFFGMEFLATYLARTGVLPDSQLELYGLFGMVIFMTYISILMVRFKTFHTKAFGAQMLVLALIVLIGSQFFYVKGTTLIGVTSVTLILTGVIGINLIRGVKKEIKLRESLQVSNENQTNLIYVMNHQIKGRLGNIKNVFAEILGGDYGVVPPDARPLLQKGLDEIETGVSYVQGILKGATAANSGLQYKMESMDFSEVVTEAVSSMRAKALAKNLNLHFTTVPGIYTIQGDKVQLGEALHNLIDNSINYTLEGSIDITLESTKKEVVFKIRDTGVGLSDKDKASLFKTGGRGEESLSYNVNSTGYGLVFVKSVAEAHKGSVFALSEGRGHGSTFILHLPR